MATSGDLKLAVDKSGPSPAATPSIRKSPKYADLPPQAVAELEITFADIARRYGTSGPAPGEDET